MSRPGNFTSSVLAKDMIELMNREANHAGCPRWLGRVLIVAGIYNLLFGLGALVAPNFVFDLLHLTRLVWPQIWQCLGMVIGVYGVGYIIAASNPLRHWPIVLVGLLGKVFGPVGYIYYATKGDFPWSWGWLILFNDVIWWVLFMLILYRAARTARPLESKSAVS